MTKIAIDARMARSSGIGTVITNVSRRLIQNNPRWNFFVLGDPEILNAFDWMSAPNVAVVAFKAPIYSIAEQLRFPHRRLRDCDMLWAPNYNIPLLWKRKLLVTVHDVAHVVLPEIRKSAAKRLYARGMFAWVRARANAIAFVSDFSKKEFQRTVGSPRGQAVVIPCGVDERWFEAAPHTTSQSPYILFVGNLKPHKNLGRLVDAFDQVRKDIPHILKIIGKKDGFITGDEDIIERANVGDGRILFTGYVPEAQIQELYANASALVLPSLYEGFGLPPLEAMAAGCPTLVSRTAALPEVCQDAALYCDPLDVGDIARQLRRIVEDESLRQTLKNRGLERARKMSWGAVAVAYQDVIRTLIE